MNSLVQSNHNDDTYDIFIETGCGVPVANVLYNIGGASKKRFTKQNHHTQ